MPQGRRYRLSGCGKGCQIGPDGRHISLHGRQIGFGGQVGQVDIL
jgi:hypothetical protein